jgi:serine phosphatase RsbU (regulator of sigma subunit)
VAAFLAVAVAGPALGIRMLDGESGELLRLSAARQGVDALVREHLVEETSLRGFVSTRDPSYLEPLGPPDPGFAGRITKLVAAVRATGAPDAVPLVERIGAVHAEWERRVAAPLLHDPDQLDTYDLQSRGRRLTDELRVSGQRLRALLGAASDRVEAELRRTIDLTVAISAAIVALFALAAVVLGLARATALQRLERERVLVDALQQTLRVGGTQLPFTDLGFAYVSATADALIGGDLLDSWRVGEDTGWFLIADASGKGIQAARHSAFVQYAVRALTAEYDDPGIVATRFNKLFIETFADPSVFVVLFLGRFDGRTNVLRYVAAGHSTAFVRRGTAIEQLAPTGPIVGLELDSTFGVADVALPVGSTVLLATDGLTESRDAAGEFLGDDGVVRLLAAAPIDPQGICDYLVGEAERRSGGEIADDLAILAITVLALENGSERQFSTMEAAPRR